MAESHVVSALKDKRAELSGEVLVTQARLDKLRLDIAAVDRALLMFDPEAKPKNIVPVIRRRRDTRFRHGAWTAAVMRILRTAARPLTVREIANIAANEFNIPHETPMDLMSLDNRVRMTLKKQRQGVVSEWTDGITIWRIDNKDDSMPES
jgi:hypothetical protein